MATPCLLWLCLFAVPHQQAVHHVFRQSHEQQWEGDRWGRCGSVRSGDHSGGRKDLQHAGTATHAIIILTTSVTDTDTHL